MENSYNTKIIDFGSKINIVKYSQDKLRKSNTSENKSVKEKQYTDEELKQRSLHHAYRVRRNIQYYVLSNNFNQFWTLTFNDNVVDGTDYEKVRKILVRWLKYQREKYGKFGYIFIPEYHKKGERIHFHGVTEEYRAPIKEARYPKSNKLIKKNGKQIFNSDEWVYGFSTVSVIEDNDKMAGYLTKYITKEVLNIPREYNQPSYLVSRGLKKPTISYAKLDSYFFEHMKPSVVLCKNSSDIHEINDYITIYNIDSEMVIGRINKQLKDI